MKKNTLWQCLLIILLLLSMGLSYVSAAKPPELVFINQIDKYDSGNWLFFIAAFIVLLLISYRNKIIQKELEKRLLVQEQLTISEQKFSLLFDLSPILVDSFDENGRCVLWNKECEKVFGWTKEELNQHKEPLALFYPDPEIRKHVIDSVCSGGDNVFREWYPITKSGKQLVNLWANIILPSGDVINIGYDISEQRKKEIEIHEKNQELKEQKEQLILAKQNAEKANRSKSEFLANMSHEIRTPLNGVIGLLNLLQQTTLTDKQSDYINKIDVSSQLLLEVINDILDFSKIEAGKLIIENIHFSLQDLIANVEDIMQLKASEKNLSFIIDNQSCVDFFYGDSLRLSQVLINLLNNAIKFTQKGKVELKIESLDDHYLKFSVIDSGIGISDEQQASLFQAFNQLDNSTTRKYGGSGLGLTISKQLVELMGGTISLKSQLGEGSQFIFTIKLLPGDKNNIKFIRPYQTQMHSLSVFKDKQVLLVEDNKINQEVLALFLRESGFLVSIANNGEEALQKLSSIETIYDAVLMDIHMPIMDGYKATEKIRNELGLKQLPIIALTANIMQDVKQECLSVGMNDYLSKPVNYSQLLNVLSKNMQLNRTIVDEEEADFISDDNYLHSDENVQLLGIDQTIARQFLGDDTEQLKKVLIQFREQYAQVDQQINDYIKQQNYLEAHLLTHSIKGVSSIMGATMLSEAALILEKQLLLDKPDRDKLRENLQQFKRHLAQIIHTSHIL